MLASAEPRRTRPSSCLYRRSCRPSTPRLHHPPTRWLRSTQAVTKKVAAVKLAKQLLGVGTMAEEVVMIVGVTAVAAAA